MLPEGMFMHRKYDKIMDHPVVSMGENYNVMLASKKFSFVIINYNLRKKMMKIMIMKKQQEI